MRRRAGTIAIGGLLALGAGAAACSSDSGDGLSAREQEFADAFAEDLADDDDGLGVAEDEGICMADAIMVELGAEPFDDAGVEPEDLQDSDESPGELLGSGVVSDDQADAIGERWADCADVEAVLAASLGADLDLADDAIDCLAEGMREGDVGEEFVRISFTVDDPEVSDDVVRDLVALADECSGEEGGPLVDSLAESFAADGSLDEAEARCVAQGVIDIIGVDRLLEVTAESGEFEGASPEIQQEMTRAVLDATVECGIPLDRLSGD
jgi:hypothetical protein